MKKTKLTTALALSVCCGFLTAQNDEWRNFTSGEQVFDVAWEGNVAWVGTDGGLARYDDAAGETQFFNRANSGLPIHRVYDVAVAPDGVKWLGTQLGLARFDGTDWQLFNPNAGDPIFGYQLDARAMALDAAGNVWVRAQSETFWQFHDGVWIRHDQANFFQEHGLGTMTLGADGALLLVYSASEIYRFDGTDEPELLPLTGLPALTQNDVEDVFRDADGRLWLWVVGYGLLEINDLNVTPHPLNFYGGDHIAVSPDGNWWTDDWGCGLTRIVADGAETVFNITASIYACYVNDIQTDPAGRTLLLSESGLWRLENETLVRIPTANSGLGANFVIDVETGPNGQVWITDSENGSYHIVGDNFGTHINRYDQGDWQRWSWYETPGQAPYCFKEIKTDSNGLSWIAACEDGLKTFDGDTWTTYPAPELPWGHVMSVGLDPWHEAVWVGGRDKIARWQNGGFTAYDTPFADYADITCIAPAPDGRIWTADNLVSGRIAYFENGAWTEVDTATMGLPPYPYGFAKIAAAPNGDVWVLANYSGIARFDGTSWQSYTYANMGTPLIYYASAVAFDGDVVWLGFYDFACFTPNTQFCLAKIEGDTWTFYWFEENGLPYPTITSLAVDAAHNVWVGTDAGLGVFNENGIVLGEKSPGAAQMLTPLRVEIRPNPMRRQAQLSAHLSEASDVRLSLFAIDGNLVRQTVFTDQPAGSWERPLSAEGLPAGVYFYRLETDSGIGTGKLVVY